MNTNSNDLVRELESAFDYLVSRLTVMAILYGRVKFVERHDIDTMAVDEKLNIYYNPEFVKENIKHLPALVFHEILHIQYDSFARKRVADSFESSDVPENIRSMFFNVASDLLINETVKAIMPEVGLPEGAIDFKTYLAFYSSMGANPQEVERGRTTEYYYHKLLYAYRKMQQNSQNTQTSILKLLEKMAGSVIDPDNHNDQEVANRSQQNAGQESQMSDGSPQDSRSNGGTNAKADNDNKSRQDSSDGDGLTQAEKDMIYAEQNGRSKGGDAKTDSGSQKKQDSPDGSEGLTRTEKDMIYTEIERQIEDNIKRGKMQGKDSFWGEEGISLREKETPEWTTFAILSRIFNQKAEQSMKKNPTRINKQTVSMIGASYSGIHKEKILVDNPYVKKTEVKVAVAVDTSGSMSPSDLSTSLSKLFSTAINLEKTGIIETRITYVEADVNITDVKEFKNTKSFIEYMKQKSSVKGRGGTEYLYAINYINGLNVIEKKNYDVMVYFTDGYCDITTELEDAVRQLTKSGTKLVFAITEDGTTEIVKHLAEKFNRSVFVSKFQDRPENTNRNTNSVQTTFQPGV